MKKALVNFSFASLVLSLFLSNAALADGHWMIGERFEGFDTETNAGAINVDHYTVPELDATYFFNRNFAAEFSITAEDPSTSDRNTGESLGDVWIIPFNALLQYHFSTGTAIQPYIGAGLNVSLFYPSSNNVNYNNSVGPVFQVGSDFQLDRNWFLNIDVKKEYISPDVSINGSPMASDDLDPWVFGLGIRYKF